MTKKKSSLIYSKGGIDFPVESVSEDKLNRRRFAERLYRIVSSHGSSENIRVGVIGPWGTGKTSVMNFVKEMAKHDGNPVAVFNPWQYPSRETAWRGFVFAVEQAIAELNGKKIGITTSQRKELYKAAAKMTSHVANISNSQLGKCLNALILSPLIGKLESAKIEVQKLLDDGLKDKRLFVFIDDIDRAEAELVYELLMLLNEVVNFEKCVFIVALDMNSTLEVLNRKLGMKESTSKGYLEKIINWFYYLPELEPVEVKDLIHSELAGKETTVKIPVLFRMVGLLPRNPRKIKTYVSYLNGLHKEFLDRFDDDEVSWRAMYLIQLLRMEYPNVYESLVKDPDFISEMLDDAYKSRISDYGLPGGVGSKEKEEKKSAFTSKTEKILALVSEEERKNNLEKIVGAIQGSLSSVNREDAKKHFAVLEDLEPLTWKEFRKEIVRWLNANYETRKRLITLFVLENTDSNRIQRLRGFLKFMAEYGGSMFGKITDTVDRVAVGDKTRELNKIYEIADIILDESLNCPSGLELFDESTFGSWYRWLKRYAHFTNEHAYLAIRKRESELFLKLCSNLKVDYAKALGVLYDVGFTVSDSDRSFEQALDSGARRIEERIIYEMLKRFEESELAEYYEEIPTSVAEKLFHSLSERFVENPGTIDRLKELQDKASGSVTVFSNFVHFFREISKYLFSGRELPKNYWDMNKVILEVVWQGATAREINVRFWGTLKNYRDRIRKMSSDGDFLPDPEWVAEK